MHIVFIYQCTFSTSVKYMSTYSYVYTYNYLWLYSVNYNFDFRDHAFGILVLHVFQALGIPDSGPSH